VAFPNALSRTAAEPLEVKTPTRPDASVAAAESMPQVIVIDDPSRFPGTSCRCGGNRDSLEPDAAEDYLS
jgi:hypothetical protein